MQTASSGHCHKEKKSCSNRKDKASFLEKQKWPVSEDEGLGVQKQA